MSLSLLFMSLSSVSANAALSSDEQSISIEREQNSAELRPLDKLLDGGNVADLFGSVTQRHDNASQSVKNTMDGHFGRAGSEKPVEFGHGNPTDKTVLTAPPVAPGEVPNYSLTVAANKGVYAQTEGDTTPISSPASSAVGSSFAPNVAGNLKYQVVQVAPVPLPAAGLLLASGLAVLPAMRRKRQE
jgi:hypothetical protein